MFVLPYAAPAIVLALEDRRDRPSVPGQVNHRGFDNSRLGIVDVADREAGAGSQYAVTNVFSGRNETSLADHVIVGAPQCKADQLCSAPANVLDARPIHVVLVRDIGDKVAGTQRSCEPIALSGEFRGSGCDENGNDSEEADHQRDDAAGGLKQEGRTSDRVGLGVLDDRGPGGAYAGLVFALGLCTVGIILPALALLFSSSRGAWRFGMAMYVVGMAIEVGLSIYVFCRY